MLWEKQSFSFKIFLVLDNTNTPETWLQTCLPCERCFCHRDLINPTHGINTAFKAYLLKKTFSKLFQEIKGEKELSHQLTITHGIDSTEMAWEVTKIWHALCATLYIVKNVIRFYLAFQAFTLALHCGKIVYLVVGGRWGGVQGKCGEVIGFKFWELDRDLVDTEEQSWLTLMSFGNDSKTKTCSDRNSEKPCTKD